MANVIIRFKVRNYSDWKAIHEDYTSIRKDAGEVSYTIYYEEHNPNSLILFMEWDVPVRARIWLHSEPYKRFLVNSGVVGDPETVYIAKAGSGRL